MEAVVHHDVTKTVDQTLKEILGPEQETIWEQIKDEARRNEASLYALRETDRLAKTFPLSDEQKKQLLDALAQFRLRDQERMSHSSADVSAQGDKQAPTEETIVGEILSPAEMVIYAQQRKTELEMIKKQKIWADQSPIARSLSNASTLYPHYQEPAPLMGPLPKVTLQYNMPGP